jgi:hypothetical protein
MMTMTGKDGRKSPAKCEETYIDDFVVGVSMRSGEIIDPRS